MISHLITNNVVWNNGWGFTSWGWGGGIVVSSSSGAEVATNVVAWNADGIDVISQNRGDPGWSSVTDVYVHDNTIVLAPRAGDTSDMIALGWLQDWAGVMFNASSANRGASNAYWIGSPEPESARFAWNGPIDTLAAFNATPGEEGGRYLTVAERDQVLGAAGIAGARAIAPIVEPSRPAVGVGGMLVAVVVAGSAVAILCAWHARRLGPAA